jgi:thiol-disulfide isomerase/thioredoxin
MTRLVKVGLIAACLIAWPGTAVRAGDDTARAVAIGEQVGRARSLRDLKGNRRSLRGFKDYRAIVVAFVGVDCPLANLYMPRLLELERRYREQGVQFLAVYSNEGETLDEVAAHAYERDIPFVVLKDFEQGLARMLGVERTPTAVVLDGEFVLRYRGRIDDQYGVGYRRAEATEQNLVTAIDAVLAGEDVAEPQVETDGCLIARHRPTATVGDVTYTRDVAGILQNRCQECHRAGQIGPFALSSFDDAVRHAAMNKEVTVQRRMPPWHADARYGKFRNDRRMSDEEIATLAAWVEGGMREGDAADLPEPVQWHEGWNIGEPDQVIRMPVEFDVPADGVVDYKYFPVKTGFGEDRWVQATEIKPDAPAVVHHIIVYLKMPGKRLYDPRGDVSMLAAWAPGDPPQVCPPGTAVRIPKEATLLFEVHYTPNGKAAKDRSSVGIVFAKEPPQRELHYNIFLNKDIRLPPNDPHYRAEAEFTFPRDARILSLLPHMHYRGKSFHYEAVYPDGRRETLLSVPRWDFNWQTNYWFAEPLRVPKGTRLRAVAHWDNSRNNPANPDPSKEVHYGLQSFDEMLNGWVHYVWEEPEGAAASAGE